MATGVAQESLSSPALSYATPLPRAALRGWAGAAVILGGLCLVVLGGCFLIGVMMLVSRVNFNGEMALPARLTAPQMILMSVLYILGFASFGGAVAMLVAGTRALLRLMRS
jgi:hypothetical protein